MNKKVEASAVSLSRYVRELEGVLAAVCDVRTRVLEAENSGHERKACVKVRAMNLCE